MYDPEKIYADRAKCENRDERVSDMLYDEMWENATTEEGATKVYNLNTSDFLLEAIRNIAITREAALKAPLANVQAIKAHGFDSIIQLLDAVIRNKADDEAIYFDDTPVKEREYD